MRKIILLVVLFCAFFSAYSQDANKNATSAIIDDSIRTNGQNKITASTLNAILHLINNINIDSLQAINAINAQKGLTNGIAALSGGKVPVAQLPVFLNAASVINDTSVLITLSTGQLDTLVIKGSSVGASDTISLSNRINASVKYLDTATMLFAYLRYTLGVKYADTGAMLAPYLLISNFTPTMIGLGNLANQLQVINAGGMNSMKVGAYASIPAPGSGPTIYYASDTNALYYNTGSSYVKISGGSGTINFAQIVAILGYTPTSPTLLADTAAAVRLALVDTSSAIRAAIASGGLAFTNRANGYLNAYGSLVTLNSDSITAGTTNKFFVVGDTAGLAEKATQTGLTDTATAIRTALTDSIATVHTILGDTAATLRALIAGNATQTGLNDTAAAIRGTIVSSAGAGQTILNDSTAALRIALSDTATAIRTALNNYATQVALGDTAAALRTLNAALQTGLLDSAAAIRTALTDTAAAHRTLIGLSATQIGLGDTASAVRTALIDTGANIRTALIDTAANLRTTIGTLATQTALVDTAAAIRTALLDTASNHRTLIATLASQVGLTDSAGALRTALVDTAAALRSAIGTGGVAQIYAKLPMTILGTDTAVADTTIGHLNALATIHRLYYVTDSLSAVSFNLHVNNIGSQTPIASIINDTTLDFATLEAGTNVTFDTTIYGVIKINSSGGGSYDSVPIYAALSAVRDSVDSIQSVTRIHYVLNTDVDPAADTLAYAIGNKMYIRQIQDSAIWGINIGKTFSSQGVVVYSLLADSTKLSSLFALKDSAASIRAAIPAAGVTQTVLNDTAAAIRSTIGASMPTYDQTLNQGSALTANRDVTGAGGAYAMSFTSLSSFEAQAPQISFDGMVQFPGAAMGNSNYTMPRYSSIVIPASTFTANRTLTLPTAITNGVIFVIDENNTAYSLTISPSIEDASGNSYSTLINGSSYLLMYDGTNWVIQSQYPAPSGPFSPTVTNSFNVTSSSLLGAKYVQNGNQVTVSYAVTVVSTSNLTVSQLKLSLPVPSDLSNTYDAFGQGIWQPGTLTGSITTSGDVAQAVGNAGGGGTGFIYVQFYNTLGAGASGTLLLTVTYTID